MSFRTHETKAICETKHQILDIIATDQEIWIASANSSLISYQRMESKREIHGKPCLVNCQVTDNKKYVVTKDSESQVQVLNVLEGTLENSQIGLEDTIKQFNTGRNSNSWFTANLRLGCLMLDFNQHDINAAGEITDDRMIVYGEMFIRKLFYYLILYEEQIMKEKDGYTQDRFIVPKTCGLEDTTIILSQVFSEGIMQPLCYTLAKYIAQEPNLLLPIWLQKLVYRSKSK